jgi:ketosteroid isomerase-like protein
LGASIDTWAGPTPNQLRFALSVEDRLVIQEMIAEYSYTYDSNDANGFAQLFVEDGVFEVFVPGKTTAVFVLQSRAAIYEWAKQRLEGRHGAVISRHHQTGILFEELTPDAARTRTMVLVTHQLPDEASPRPTVTGSYQDIWRRTDAGWRIVRRSAHVDREVDLTR